MVKYPQKWSRTRHVLFSLACTRSYPRRAGRLPQVGHLPRLGHLLDQHQPQAQARHGGLGCLGMSRKS